MCIIYVRAMATTNYQYDEIKLIKNSKDRELYDNLSDVYSLLMTIQFLEKAFIKDSICSSEYTASCFKLLTQFKTAFKLVSKDFASVEDFTNKYGMDVQLALERIKSDRPLTINSSNQNISKNIATIVTIFITIMDKLRLQVKSTDELLPDLNELVDSLKSLHIIPKNFEPLDKLANWSNKMSLTKASDELDEEKVRQLLFDLEQAFNSFNKLL